MFRVKTDWRMHENCRRRLRKFRRNTSRGPLFPAVTPGCWPPSRQRGGFYLPRAFSPPSFAVPALLGSEPCHLRTWPSPHSAPCDSQLVGCGSHPSAPALQIAGLRASVGGIGEGERRKGCRRIPWAPCSPSGALPGCPPPHCSAKPLPQMSHRVSPGHGHHLGPGPSFRLRVPGPLLQQRAK